MLFGVILLVNNMKYLHTYLSRDLNVVPSLQKNGCRHQTKSAHHLRQLTISIESTIFDTSGTRERNIEKKKFSHEGKYVHIDNTKRHSILFLGMFLHNCKTNDNKTKQNMKILVLSTQHLSYNLIICFSNNFIVKKSVENCNKLILPWFEIGAFSSVGIPPFVARCSDG